MPQDLNIPGGLPAPPQLSRGDFATQVRTTLAAQHGGDPYADLHDDELVDLVTAKYPIYQTWITKHPGLPGPTPPATPGPIPSPEYLATSAPPSRRVASAKTGGVATEPALGTSIFDRPAEGAVTAGTGAARLVTGYGGRRNAAADVIEGGLQAAEPLALVAPVKPLIQGVVAGAVASGVTQKALEYAGFSPETTRLAADVAGLAGGAVGAEAPGKVRTYLRERPRPIPGVLEGPPTQAGARPMPADIVGEPTWRETQRMVENDQFNRGFQSAQAGEAAAQTTVTMQQAAELRAFEARIAAGMDPLTAVTLQHQGITNAPPALKQALALNPAPPSARASFIAYPPDAPPPNPNLREVTRPELAGARGTQKIIAEGPPPPLEDVLAGQLEDSLGQPPRQEIGLVKQPFNLARQKEPPTLAQTQARLKARPNRMRGRVQGIGAESISRSGGGAITEGRQSRLADLAEHRPAPPQAEKDPVFKAAAQAALDEGYQGSPAELWRRYQDEVDKADLLNELHGQYGPRALLREVARRGGIGHWEDEKYASGEVRQLWEGRDLAAGPIGQNRRLAPGKPHQGTYGGVGSVLRRGGRSLDAMGDSFREAPVEGWEHITDGASLHTAMETARRQIANGEFGEVQPNLGEGWWRRAPEQDTASELADWFTQQGERAGQDELEGAYQEYLKLFGPGGEGGPPMLGDDSAGVPRGTSRPADIPETAEIVATPERYRELARQYGPPNAHTDRTNATDALTAKKAGAAFIDDDTGEIVAYAPPGVWQPKPVGERVDPASLGGGRREAQPVLPGAEDVRTQEIATPEMDAPFSLGAPPSREQAVQPGLFGEPVPPPAKPKAGKKPAAQGPSLFDRLSGEEGVLILDVPPGDPIGLKRWLEKHESTHGDDPWYHRVAQALEDGNASRAWNLAAAASARDIAAIGVGRMTAEERRAVQGTQFAQLTGRSDMVGPKGGGASAHPDATPVVAPPPVKPGQRGKGVTAGPATGGLLRPPPPRRPLPGPPQKGDLSVVASDMTLGKVWQKSLLEHSDPSLVTLIEGNQDTAFRLFRQIADQAVQGLNTQEAKRYLHMSDLEIASHYQRAPTMAGKLLSDLSSWRRQNYDNIQFLRPTGSGELKFAGPGGQFASGPPAWMNEAIHIGRGREIVPGVTPSDRTLEALAQEGLSLEKLQAIWAISKPDPHVVGKFAAVENFSRALLVSKPVTALRNFWTQTGRYGVAALDDALAGTFSAVAGDTAGARDKFITVRERLKSMGRPGGVAVHPWAEGMQAIYDYSVDSLGQLPAKDIRKSLAAIEAFPRRAADFMGYAAGEADAMGGPGGVQQTVGQSRVPGLQTFMDDVFLDPKVRNYLTVFNRGQEHTIRAVTADAVFRSQLYQAGYDPTVLLEGDLHRPGGLFDTVPTEQLDQMTGTAVYRALDETFASVPLTDSIPGRLLQTFSRHPLLLRFNYPFPRFNLLAAPRFIYDHSPAGLLDLFAYPFERGRLFRGVQAEGITQTHLPEIQTKLAGKELELGQHLKGVIEARRELGVRSRLLDRAQKRATTQQAPGMGDPVAEARAAVLEAREAVEAARAQVGDTKEALKDLRQQEEVLQKKVREAGQIGAPTLPEFWARQATGTLGLFGAALALRTSDGAKDTEWYEYRWDRGNGESSLIDLRSFAPFVQYLYPADVIQDLYHHTDWDAVRAELPEGVTAINPTNYLPLYRAVWDHYAGKYTPEKLSTEFAQAFFSMSRAAGTTLTIVDLLTQRGWPGPGEIAEALIGSVGQFLARFTVPLSTAKEAVAQFDPEEAKVRIAPPVSAQQPYGPLAAPLANVPYASRLIPETTSQTTGEPLKSVNPFGRELSGLTEKFRSDIESEFKRIGMPSQAIYIPKTNDQGLDTTLAQTYAHYLQEYLPGVLQGDPTYRNLKTPADQREYLGRILAGLRRAAVGEVKANLGAETVQQAREGPAARAKRLRRERLLKQVEAGQPIVIEGEPQEPAEPEPQGPPGRPGG